MKHLCRNCLSEWDVASSNRQNRCHNCGSPRILSHPELDELTIAHMDCDAFYAAVEKRDNPDLCDKAIIVAYDAPRSVVSTCCYMARMYGVRSAMPLFKAKKLCPEGIIVKPRMDVYSEVSKKIHTYYQELTPIIEPLSLDEAFLDLTGTERLHRRSAAQSMAWLAKTIEEEIGITVSIGLSYNKSLAKLASDLDKPNGFAIIGRAEAKEFLAKLPVSDIWGVGKALNKKLAQNGITTIGQLQHKPLDELTLQYGSMGERLFHFSRGEDSRSIKPSRKAKSISNETTFSTDVSDFKELDKKLWRLCENVSSRLKKKSKAGKTITLKLKTADFKTITRSHSLEKPTQLAETLYQEASFMLQKVVDGKLAFRLIGVGASTILDADEADIPDLMDTKTEKNKSIESAMDNVRKKFGSAAINKGRAID